MAKLYILVPVIVGGGGSKGFFVVAAFAVIAIGTGGFGLFTAPTVLQLELL